MQAPEITEKTTKNCKYRLQEPRDQPRQSRGSGADGEEQRRRDPMEQPPRALCAADVPVGGPLGLLQDLLRPYAGERRLLPHDKDRLFKQPPVRGPDQYDLPRHALDHAHTALSESLQIL